MDNPQYQATPPGEPFPPSWWICSLRIYPALYLIMFHWANFLFCWTPMTISSTWSTFPHNWTPSTHAQLLTAILDKNNHSALLSQGLPCVFYLLCNKAYYCLYEFIVSRLYLARVHFKGLSWKALNVLCKCKSLSLSLIQAFSRTDKIYYHNRGGTVQSN